MNPLRTTWLRQGLPFRTDKPVDFFSTQFSTVFSTIKTFPSPLKSWEGIFLIFVLNFSYNNCGADQVKPQDWLKSFVGSDGKSDKKMLVCPLCGRFWNGGQCSQLLLPTCSVCLFSPGITTGNYQQSKQPTEGPLRMAEGSNYFIEQKTVLHVFTATTRTAPPCLRWQ